MSGLTDLGYGSETVSVEVDVPTVVCVICGKKERADQGFGACRRTDDGSDRLDAVAAGPPEKWAFVEFGGNGHDLLRRFLCPTCAHIGRRYVVRLCRASIEQLD